jgi:hypothetical protein
MELAYWREVLREERDVSGGWEYKAVPAKNTTF